MPVVLLIIGAVILYSLYGGSSSPIPNSVIDINSGYEPPATKILPPVEEEIPAPPQPKVVDSLSIEKPMPGTYTGLPIVSDSASITKSGSDTNGPYVIVNGKKLYT